MPAGGAGVGGCGSGSGTVSAPTPASAWASVCASAVARRRPVRPASAGAGLAAAPSAAVGTGYINGNHSTLGDGRFCTSDCARVDPDGTVTLLGREFALTGALVTVSLVLGALSGLSFTISAMSDAAYRATFFSEADRELQRVFAARAVYRAAVAGPVPAGAAVVSVDPTS